MCGRNGQEAQVAGTEWAPGREGGGEGGGRAGQVVPSLGASLYARRGCGSLLQKEQTRQLCPHKDSVFGTESYHPFPPWGKAKGAPGSPESGC